MNPIISVIIPCYNSGEFLLEAIESVEKYHDKNVYEIIVVNDGSTEEDTLVLLNELKKNSYNVIHQENKGPAAARNTGVINSHGKFLLFLDSDNKVRPAYITKGIEILSKKKEVGIVYGNPIFFGGNSDRHFKPKEFDLKSILHGNYIDVCTVTRREVWEEVGGFDENRDLTQEDWEFWIRVGKTKWKFFYIDEPMFDYRIRDDSHVTKSKSQYNNLLKYVYLKHIDLFIDNYHSLNSELQYYKILQERPFRLALKALYKRVFNHNN